MKTSLLTMKNSKVANALGMGVLALSLAVLPAAIPASAQSSAPGVGGSTSGDTATTTTYNNDDRNGYWGLLGLLGLFGLMGRKSGRDESTTYRDPSSTETTGSRRY